MKTKMQNKAKTKKANSWEIMKFLWDYSSRNKFWVILVLITSLLSAGFSLFAVFLMSEIVGSIMYLSLVNFTWNSTGVKFVITISMMLGSYILFFICNCIQSRLLVNISQHIGFFLRADLFKKLQHLATSFLDSQSTGNLMSIFTNDIDILVMTFSQSINTFVTGVASTIGGLLLIFLANPVLASISLGLCIILFFFLILFIKKSQPHFLKQQHLLGELSSEVQEYNFAHDMTTLYGYEKEIIDNFDKKNLELRKTTRKAQTISGLIMPYNNFINNFIITIIMLLLFVFMALKQEIFDVRAINMNLVSLAMLFLAVLRQTTSQLSQFLSQLNALQLTFAASRRVKSILDAENEPNKNRKKTLKVKQANIKFDNIHFSYVENKPILKGISFEAKQGTMNAIVGPTGSGKTTIINLLSAYYDINSGKIEIDGQDIAKCKRSSIRDNVALVLQDSFMFNTTIMENIRYGRMDATDEEVIKAAKLSNAHKFISRLPEGYKTVISNDHELLSEGEKQLISIARIFLSKAKILVLDEATSYVDTKTEKDIQAATRRLMKSRTSIVIAHRLSTIKDADNIVVIKDGEQIEMGNHQQLMKNKKFYYQLNTAMDGNFDIEQDR